MMGCCARPISGRSSSRGNFPCTGSPSATGRTRDSTSLRQPVTSSSKRRPLRACGRPRAPFCTGSTCPPPAPRRAVGAGHHLEFAGGHCHVRSGPGLGCLAALTEPALLRLRRQPSASPYAGWMAWHHYAGLLFGVVSLTWVFSGLLSMDPWDWHPSTGPTRQQRSAFAGGAYAIDTVSVEQLAHAVPRLHGTRAAELVQSAGGYSGSQARDTRSRSRRIGPTRRSTGPRSPASPGWRCRAHHRRCRLARPI